jgi:NAD-dependent dihydropyrimidine dehydrogenase PreA subunit
MKYHYLKNGETLSLDPALCNGCATCIEVCPHGVFALAGGVSTIVDREACMECGACARNCAPGALRVTAGVGCAAAVLGGLLRGSEASCGCGGECAESGIPVAGGKKGCC